MVPGKRYAIYNSATGKEVYSGTFTVTFSAYFPYGILSVKDFTGFVDDQGIGQYCGILRRNMMPVAPTVSSTNFLLYNCGTQTCGTVLRVGGTANAGLTITNHTNGTSCTLASLPSTGYLEVDSRYGSIKWVHGNAEDFAFNYHVKGFITLTPYMACEDEIVVSHTSGSAIITRQNDKFDERFIGKYIYVSGTWQKIATVAVDGTATINGIAASTGITQTKVVTMNEITVAGTNAALTKLEVDYFPIIV